MKFRFIWVGKTRDKNWKALQEEYLKRLSHFVKFEIDELRDPRAGDSKETEGTRIIDALPKKTFAVLLDTSGDALGSKELAGKLEKWQMESKREIAFIIGGPEGASAVLAERADYRLSLSFLTFTHEMARVLLLEQLYRAFSILKGFPYQK